MERVFANTASDAIIVNNAKEEVSASTVHYVHIVSHAVAQGFVKSMEDAKLTVQLDAGGVRFVNIAV